MGGDANEILDALALISFNPRPRMGGDFMFWDCGIDYRVSIHAPAWGATNEKTGGKNMEVVSIHAPAWGATFTGVDYTLVLVVSIHAPAWGATNHIPLSLPFNILFQSTPPHGGRPNPATY